MCALGSLRPRRRFSTALIWYCSSGSARSCGSRPPRPDASSRCYRQARGQCEHAPISKKSRRPLFGALSLVMHALRADRRLTIRASSFAPLQQAADQGSDSIVQSQTHADRSSTRRASDRHVAGRLSSRRRRPPRRRTMRFRPPLTGHSWSRQERAKLAAAPSKGPQDWSSSDCHPVFCPRAPQAQVPRPSCRRLPLRAASRTLLPLIGPSCAGRRSSYCSVTTRPSIPAGLAPLEPAARGDLPHAGAEPRSSQEGDRPTRRPSVNSSSKSSRAHQVNLIP